jgi:type IV secretory pathway ATPase VirB11/archaellum biosynthesis ATPase
MVTLSRWLKGTFTGDKQHNSTLGCQCQQTVSRQQGTGLAGRRVLLIDARECPHDGMFETQPGCRAALFRALTGESVESIHCQQHGFEIRYFSSDATLLADIATSIARIEQHDHILAAQARITPLRTIRRARSRAGAIGRICSRFEEKNNISADDLAKLLDPHSAVPITGCSLQTSAERDLDTQPSTERVLATGGVVNVSSSKYHLIPPVATLSRAAQTALTDAHAYLQAHENTPVTDALATVGDADIPIETCTEIFLRYIKDLGILEHLICDAKISDILISSPVRETPVRVVYEGTSLSTNIVLFPETVATLASQFRRVSGRPFGRHNPLLDMEYTTSDGTQLRIAGVTAPTAPGVGFVLRKQHTNPWTLARLVSAGSLTPLAAAVCRYATIHAATCIIAGTRGAGKTTLLGALLWELPDTTRIVSIEDTAELPLKQLRAAGRDVQGLFTDPPTTDTPATSPSGALRAALRFGDGALVIGEVRGEEATALYEAMRIGAHGHAVLGTIHGDSGEAVRERVVADLGVPESAFGATDLIITCHRRDGSRFISRIEEVRMNGDKTTFVALFEYSDEGLASTGVIERGDSHLFDDLCVRAGLSYAEGLVQVESLAEHIEQQVRWDMLTPLS